LKHFPRYISAEELLKYEIEFLARNTFEPIHDFSFCERQDIRMFYKLINLVRIDAKQYCIDKNNPLKEYLISLFLITYRQIQYEDLNQLYALKLVEFLGEKINEL
jgi:hypothetical protein